MLPEPNLRAVNGRVEVLPPRASENTYRVAYMLVTALFLFAAVGLGVFLKFPLWGIVLVVLILVLVAILRYRRPRMPSPTPTTVPAPSPN